MNVHKPDGWIIVQEPTHGVRRVFGSWSGGYLDGDHWRLSTVITHQRVEEGRIVFTTASGSEYSVSREGEGRLSGYNAMVQIGRAHV